MLEFTMLQYEFTVMPPTSRRFFRLRSP